MLQAFLSYSHADQEFIHRLNAALLSNGVDTFLDEKDIVVGDSIPTKIYDGIDKSTHLIFAISATSIKSKWATEELSVAKVKEKEAEGFRILPVLLDDIDLPTSLKHILYADMRQWEDPSFFRRGFLKLLTAMGVSPRFSGIKELQWYASNSLQLREIRRSLLSIKSEMFGGFCAGQEPTADPWVHGLTPTKWALTEGGVTSILRNLISLIPSSLVEENSIKLSAIKKAAIEAADFGDKEYLQILKDIQKADSFYRLLRTVSDLMEETFMDIENILLSSVSME